MSLQNDENSVHLEITGVTTEIELPWYALRVRARAEKTVAQALRLKGYSVYLPAYTKQRRSFDRRVTVEVTLFPGYVFCRFDANERGRILDTGGVVEVVRFGGRFAVVPDSDLQAIETVLRSGMEAVAWPYLPQGSRVRVTDGPLDGLQGVLVQHRAGDRVVISVDVLQRSVAVEVDCDWLAPIRSNCGKVVA